MSLWKKILRTNFTHVPRFLEYLNFDLTLIDQCDLTPDFRLNIPLRLAEKCQKGTLEDPITRQFLPVKIERSADSSFSPDPLQEKSFCSTPRLLQKYSARSLFITTSACAMNCRFCFRREFPYEKKPHDFQEELALIEKDTTQQELLLSGGDPLSLDDTVLSELLQKIDAISHITRIRFHTRFPIGIPERIDDAFLSLLEKTQKQLWFIIHVNHPLELDEEVIQQLKKIVKLGIPVLAQTVLLKGVNDSFSTLKALFEKCANHGLIPYYLYQLDRVQGAHHFEVEIEEGQRLMRELTQALPGYAVPRYVQEIAGRPSKSLISL